MNDLVGSGVLYFGGYVIKVMGGDGKGVGIIW